MNEGCCVSIIRQVHQEQCTSALFYFLMSFSVPYLGQIHQEQLMHSYVSPYILTLQLMSVDFIVQQVQYKYLTVIIMCYCFHQLIEFWFNSGSRILKASLIQPGYNTTSFFHISFHSILFYHSCQLCVLFGVFSVWRCYKIAVFKVLSFVFTGPAPVLVYV